MSLKKFQRTYPPVTVPPSSAIFLAMGSASSTGMGPFEIGFPLEARQPVGVGRERLGQHLQRYVPIERRVSGLPDFPHAAFADLGGDSIGAEGGAGLQWHRSDGHSQGCSPAPNCWVQFCTTWICPAGESGFLRASKKSCPSGATSYATSPVMSGASKSGRGVPR